MNHPDYRCSGFRTSIWPEAYQLFNKSDNLFQVAWRNGDYMATHAGILSDWKIKYNDRLSYYEEKFSIDRVENLDILLNAVNDTHDRWILNTVGMVRGGNTGSVGGPLWADISEILEGGLSPTKYTHVVGHNNVPTICSQRDKNGTQVIFTDCLGKETNFLTITK